jgi:hypothetical protein
MNVGIQLNGFIHQVEVDASNAMTFCLYIYIDVVNVILWLVIDVDIIDYNSIYFSFPIDNKSLPMRNILLIFMLRKFKINFKSLKSITVLRSLFDDGMKTVATNQGISMHSKL